MANQWELLSTLSHPTRHAILDRLREGPYTVGELASQLPVTRPAVSQHLQLLKSVGLVTEERRGTRHYFYLSTKSLAELRAHLDSLWRDALAAFSEFSKKEPTIDVAKSKKTRANSTKRSR
jgi:DNA-binding transcriptional ArsR family regulator